jgi:hypothetical protein
VVPQYALLPSKLSRWALFQSPHFGSMPLYLLNYHKQNLENSFDKLPTCTLGFSYQFYDELDFSSTPLQLPTIP